MRTRVTDRRQDSNRLHTSLIRDPSFARSKRPNLDSAIAFEADACGLRKSTKERVVTLSGTEPYFKPKKAAPDFSETASDLHLSMSG